MKIDIISWKFQENRNALLLEYKINEQIRRMIVFTKDFKNRILLDYNHIGINESNWDDILDGKDPKHSLTNEMMQSFVLWLHSV